jgi:hypothetical protein
MQRVKYFVFPCIIKFFLFSFSLNISSSKVCVTVSRE